MWLRIFKHLLPHGRPWRLTINRNLRALFDGLSGIGSDAKDYIDQAWQDIFPDTTRELASWEDQFGLPNAGLTDQERRDRLAATWKALGGQDPSYIQQVLRDNGFDVYIHEWWAPGSEPTIGVHSCTTPRSPLMYLRREFTNVTLGVECGEALAQCGESFALAGNGVEPRGYPLVNRILRTVPDTIPLCGESFAQCGESVMQAGNYSGFRTEYQNYIVTRDITKWPYFLYIGAQDINQIAQIDPKRKDEFEALCLKICPAHLWLGILVEYV